MEARIVRLLIGIIEEKCEEGKYPPAFRTSINKNCLTFLDAHTCTINYIQSRSIAVPEYLQFDDSAIIPYAQPGGNRSRASSGRHRFETPPKTIRPTRSYSEGRRRTVESKMDGNLQKSPSFGDNLFASTRSTYISGSKSRSKRIPIFRPRTEISNP